MQSDDDNALDTIGRPEPPHQEGEHAGDKKAVGERGKQRVKPGRKRQKRGAYRKFTGETTSEWQKARAREISRRVVPAPGKSGAQPLFTEELADMVLLKIFEGETLVDIAEMPGFPSRTTIFRWKTSNPDFAQRLEIAMACRNDNLVEECLYLGKQARGLPGTMSNGLKVNIDTNFKALEHFERSKRASGPKTDGPVAEDPKSIEGEAKRIDNDPLYQAFLAWDAAAKLPD